MKRILFLLVIIVGLILTFNEPIAKELMSKEPVITADLVNDAKKKKPIMNEAEVRTLTPSEIMRSKLTRNLDDLYLGYVYIPSIHLKQPVINELSNDALLTGASIIYEDMEMGKDNYVIASHFSYLSERHLFSPLYYEKAQGAQGQLIYLTDLENMYIYKTTFFEVVDPSQTQYIQRGQGKDLITLYTCNYNNYDGRIVMQGELEEVLPIDEVSEEILSALL